MEKNLDTTTKKNAVLPALTGVKGMNDVLPPDGALWENLEETLRTWLRSYGYRNMRTPILEHTALFRRSIGEVTDIVEKEMFSFTDRLNGDELTLRPEFTAGVVRSVAEHNLLYNGPQRVYSYGPVFRHERPQKGRYRQFHQLSVEALGFAGPDVDAELIVMLARLWEELNLQDIRLELNCLGQPDERQAHRAALIAYFEANQNLLDEEAQRRLHSNPLRILDSKNPHMQSMIEGAPKLADYLGETSQAHFKLLQMYLRQAGIAFTINPRLVRGLDYYNLTVFEWVTGSLGSQGTVCGGGRYDGLIGQLSGKPAPAIGFGIGLERLLLLLQEQGEAHALAAQPNCDVYVVHQGADDAAGLRAFAVAEELRGVGLDVILHAGGGSFKSQMKKADASGAAIAVIIGDNELAQGVANVKPLRADGQGVTAAQFGVSYSDLAATLATQLYA